MNWWVRRPAGAARDHVPRALLPAAAAAPDAATVATSAAGAAASDAAAEEEGGAPRAADAVLVPAACSFAAHAAEWRRQAVPAALLPALSAAGASLACVEYLEEMEGPPPSGSGCEWYDDGEARAG